MTILTVRHVTTYKYKQPVAFGEHRMMLFPREDHDQRLLELKLDIAPEPTQRRGCALCDAGRDSALRKRHEHRAVIDRIRRGGHRRFRP